MFGYRPKHTALMLALIAFASTGCGGSGAGSPMGVSAAGYGDPRFSRANPAVH
jgi:hypothetical protein